MAITAPVHAAVLPVGPSIDDPDNFDAEADAFVAAQRPFGIQQNALADNVYANALAVQALAGAADGNAQAAATSAGQASSHRVAAQQAASDAGGYALAASNSAGAAAGSADAAQNSAAAAAVAATSLTATSATSITAGTGDKVFVIGAGKQFPEGEAVAITSKGASGVRLFGVVRSYVGADLTVTVDGVEGAGTRADWVIGPGGQRGQQGIQGLTGGVNGGNLVGLLAELKAANIASAATVNVWAATGNSATLTGTTAVTSFGTAPQPGAKFTLVAAAVTPLTSGANLVLPGGVDYTTTVGDRLEIFAETTTKMDVSIFKADGTPVIGGVTYVTRTANTMLTRSDTGKFIDIISGSFTQTFDNLANLPAGWAVWIRNSGSGDITIPASDGRTNWIMYTGETRLFMKDQANGTLKSDVIKRFDRAWTSLATFVKPPGYLGFEGELWSGGPGGAGGDGSRSSGSGGAGGVGGNWASFSIPASLVNNTESIVVGGGGSPGSGGLGGSPESPGSPGTAGGAGGISSFGALVSSVSGQGSFVAGGNGGVGGFASVVASAGAGARKGGGGGGGGGKTDDGGGSVASGAPGGISTLAGAGGAGGASSNVNGVNGAAGSPGMAPGGAGGGGGGGYGTGSGGPGGVGARGEVRIRGVA